MEEQSKEQSKTPRSRTIWYISGLLVLVVVVGIVVTLLLIGRGGHGSSVNAPSAQQLIKNAQAAIQKVTSYHFNLKVDNPGTGGVLVIKSADGDILVPNKLRANASVLVVGNVVQVQLITI